MISAVDAHESALVMRGRRGPQGQAAVWVLLADDAISVAPFDEDRARAASDAFERYGKGTDAKARPNFADCAAYALAKSLSALWTFEGDDIMHTDVAPWR